MFFFLSLVGFFIPFVLLTVYPHEEIVGLEDSPNFPREWNYTRGEDFVHTRGEDSDCTRSENDDQDTFELSETDSEPALEFKQSDNDSETLECVCRHKYHKNLHSRHRLVDYDSDTDDTNYHTRRDLRE